VPNKHMLYCDLRYIIYRGNQDSLKKQGIEMHCKFVFVCKREDLHWVICKSGYQLYAVVSFWCITHWHCSWP